MAYYYGGLAVGITAFIVLLLRICCRAWSPKTQRGQQTRAQLRVYERRRNVPGNRAHGARILIYAIPSHENNGGQCVNETALPSYDASQAAAEQEPSTPPPTLASIANHSQPLIVDNDLAPPPYEESLDDMYTNVSDRQPLLTASA